MEMLVWAALIAVALHFLNTADQARRIVLLGRQLSRYRIEQLMEQLTKGYQRALAENDVARSAAIWHNLHGAEDALRDQFARFAREFAAVPEPQARVSRLPMAVPWATVWLAQGCFDMRKLLAIHAHGFERAVALPTRPDTPDSHGHEGSQGSAQDSDGANGSGRSDSSHGADGEPSLAANERMARSRARVILAEMLLMQHSCHWFCKSRTVASARLLARQQTSHEQVVATVTPDTRSAYATLVGLRS